MVRVIKRDVFLTKLSKFFPAVLALANVSKDPSSKIAAVAFSDEFHILATGYNGFPRGVVDSEERLNHRPTKLSFTVHAEANMVANAARTGVSLVGATVVVNHITPCPPCAGVLAQSGVKRVVLLNIDDEKKERWGWEESRTIFHEAGVKVLSIEFENH